MNKILVVAAHPDDEILGVGGTVKKHNIQGDEVYTLILGEGMTSRTENREDTSNKKIQKLHQQTIEAAEIIGFKKVFFSDFPDNRFDTIDLLDIIKEIEKYIDKIKPEIVYTHHIGDLNIDHEKTFRAVLTATRPFSECSVKKLYTFETPSSTEWNFNYENNRFNPNVFIDIEGTIDDKLEAMKCYKSELKKYPHPRSIKSLEIIAQKWGTVVGKKYAEAFRLIREIK